MDYNKIAPKKTKNPPKKHNNHPTFFPLKKQKSPYVFFRVKTVGAVLYFLGFFLSFFRGDFNMILFKCHDECRLNLCTKSLPPVPLEMGLNDEAIKENVNVVTGEVI